MNVFIINRDKVKIITKVDIISSMMLRLQKKSRKFHWPTQIG